MNNEKQMYFRFPNITFGRIKRYLTYAPLLKKSHHDGIYLFGRVYIGILPTRFQSIFLLAVIGFNIYHCVVKILWHASSATMLQQFRNRTGTMAVVNLIPLVIMGGRNNPLITLLNIPFDIFNLVHRWFGRIVVAEALAHMVAWAINEVNTTGWKSVGKALQSSHLIITGFVVSILFSITFCNRPPRLIALPPRLSSPPSSSSSNPNPLSAAPSTKPSCTCTSSS